MTKKPFKVFSKDSIFAEALGTLDELNSWLGLVSVKADKKTAKNISQIQTDIMLIASQVAQAKVKIKLSYFPKRIKYLENQIAILNDQLPPLKNFVIPGGNELSAQLHVARTICRRTERRLVALLPYKFPSEYIMFINRLSDLLFLLSRHQNEKIWIRK